MREFTVLVERGEDGMLIGTVPQLPGCHTQGRSLDQLMERVREAIELVLQDAADFPGQLELIGIHRIAV
jgi:predicted RNase H-like HicB family nuclease